MDNLLDPLLVAALLVWVVSRQFAGRFVAPRTRIILPLVLVVIGVEQMVTGHVPLPPLAVGVLAADLLLTAALGAVRGGAIRLSVRDGYLHQRGGWPSLGLWLVSIAARLAVALPFAHTAAGPALAASLPLSFGAGLAAQYLVFGARVRADGRALRPASDRPVRPARSTLRR